MNSVLPADWNGALARRKEACVYLRHSAPIGAECLKYTNKLLACGKVLNMLAYKPDIIIKGQDGQPVAIVEVKNRQNLTSDIAVAYRQNLLLHGMSSSVPFFLLVSQDVGLLWKADVSATADAPPTVRFDMVPVVRRYEQSAEGRRLFGVTLELLVMQWLTNLSIGFEQITQEPEKTLVTTGFIEAIRGGEIIAEASV